MPQKFYAPQIEAIAIALQNIFREGAYADKEISRVLRADKRRGSKDRAFIAETVYDIVRYYRLLTHILGREPQTQKEWWPLIGNYLIYKGYSLPDWREFSHIDRREVESKLKEAQKNRALRESIPDWMDELGEQALGDAWTATLSALNEKAPVVLRINTLQASATDVARSLASEGIHTKAIDENSLLVIERKNLFRSEAYQNGWFEVQDYSSQQAAPSLEVEPGHTVIDACAGAGGKSLHLAALMENRGKLLCLDIHEWKLRELKKRARRNGVNNLETRQITSTKTIKRLKNRADRLLLDVPCSGLGVLRRNPDSKWKLSEEFLDRMVKEQAAILQRYPQMVKPGGKMVYATCSILPRENEEQVQAFLNSPAGEGWTLESQKTYLPHIDEYDGFFVARLRKDEEPKD